MQFPPIGRSMNCPKCGAEIPDEAVQSRAATLSQAARKVRRGGRPLSAVRCPCGRYTVKMAVVRHHRC